MKISDVRITNFKSLADTSEVTLGQVNVLVGRNNHGKSAFVRAVHLMQAGAIVDVGDVRLGETSATVEMTLMSDDLSRDLMRHYMSEGLKSPAKVTLTLRHGSAPALMAQLEIAENQTAGGLLTAQTEPRNFIYTYLSKRKVTEFDQAVDLQRTQAVQANLQYLVSKVARLSNPDYVHAAEYDDLCKAVLGFRISAHASPRGMQAGLPVGAYGYIPIESMGEGVSSQLGLITDLCMADGNLFLLEEPENDIHPEGLKTLLNVIVGKSAHNQFIVTTHSNIVLRYLGAAPDSRVFEFDSTYRPNEIPTSTIRAVQPTADARIEVLRRLGYELWDFDLWDGWLILEESSAEVIIRYLIPWFVPGLARVRTVAADGTSKVEPTFEDFRRLFLFAHLERHYHGRAWVIVDGDPEGQAVVEGLRAKYKDWPPEHFSTWNERDFERYYPTRFTAEAQAALAQSGRFKRAAKKQLLDEVKAWCEADPEGAKRAFEQSAREVIDRLRHIDQELFGKRR